MKQTYNINNIDAVFGLLISSSSYVKKNWDKYFTKEYINHQNSQRLMYFDMMAISSFTIALFHKKKQKDLKSLFDAVEEILHDCDSEVQNLILAGLIEGIQQQCQYKKIDMRHEFNTWLSPLTQQNWDELTGFYHFQ
jgi:hypothetical protein